MYNFLLPNSDRFHLMGTQDKNLPSIAVHTVIRHIPAHGNIAKFYSQDPNSVQFSMSAHPLPLSKVQRTILKNQWNVHHLQL